MVSEEQLKAVVEAYDCFVIWSRIRDCLDSIKTAGNAGRLAPYYAMGVEHGEARLRHTIEPLRVYLKGKGI